jgi:GNAT superfamily N-acetyltransferase
MGVLLATPADAAALAEVAAATFPLACPPAATPESIADFISKNLSLTSFEGYLADPARVLFLAIEDGTAIGYSMLIVAEPADPDVAKSIRLRPTSELSKLYVRPGHHGAGISVALVAAAADSARAAGRTGMWLGVNQENARANRFYEKSGFVCVGTKTFQLGETYENDFVRERPL